MEKKMIYMAKKPIKEIIKAQMESIAKPRPGESDKDFLIRKGVIKQ